MHNPKEVSDVSGFFWLTVRDKNRTDDPKIGVIKLALDHLKPFHPIFFETKLQPPGGQAIGGEGAADPANDCIF